VPVGVPKEIEKLAMSIGAEHVDMDAREEALPAEKVEATIPEGDDRETAIFNAFATLEERNGREDFNAAGAPNVAPLSALVGFKVDKGERAKLWNEYRIRKAEAAEAEAAAKVTG
jgi:hypothetical protein